jgi:hypothetical protein
MARAAQEEPREIYDPNDFNSQVREFIRLKETIESLDKRQKELRDKLMDAVDEDGYEDEKGNILYEFETPVDGVVRLEKQRRATRKLDELKAEELIEAKGISEDVYKMVRVIDEDALMASFYDGKITEEELDEMFPVNVVWALRTPKK